MTYKERAWHAHLRKWRASGMTRYAFCLRHQLKVSTLDYWQRRLRDVADEKSERAAGEPARLIPIEVLASRDARYEVRFANGRQLVFSDGFDAGAVRALIDVLDAPRC